MSYRIITAIILTLLGGIFCNYHDCLAGVKTANEINLEDNNGKKLQASLFNEDGDRVPLQELRGKAVIVHFWATWCPECIPEMQNLVTFINNLQNEDYSEIILIPVVTDSRNINDIKAFMQKNNINDTAIFTDPGNALFGLLNLRTIPASLFIDKSGKIINIHKGPIDWLNQNIHKNVTEWINKQ